MILRQEGNIHAAKLCAKATSSPKAAEILKDIDRTKESVFSPVEALNIIVRTNMVCNHI